jgi:hypothetical protein
LALKEEVKGGWSKVHNEGIHNLTTNSGSDSSLLGYDTMPIKTASYTRRPEYSPTIQ